MAILGRPRKPKAKKHSNVSYSLPPSAILWISQAATKQGVPMSQVVLDAIKGLQGELANTLAELRQELADQTAIVVRLQDLANAQQRELSRLHASQNMVDSIVSPYGTKPAPANKADGEKARCVRAIANNDMSRAIVERRAMGDDKHPMLPIHQEGLKAFGSWQALDAAVKEMYRRQNGQ